MSHLSLYRKYRSQTFAELLGQNSLVTTLQNSLKQGKHSHAYLFVGPRGTGKTSAARILAKALCCETPLTGEPCNKCPHCISITQGNNFDVIEMDAASESSVENIRETVIHITDYQPSLCRYKVFIIDEVHDLSNKAFDALLKTIEEPPSHVIFILATTEYHKVPATIRSRCQKFDFQRASIDVLVKCMKNILQQENLEAEESALFAIARMADGGFRDALNLLEQTLVTSNGKLEANHVYNQLGYVNEDTLDEFLNCLKRKNLEELLVKYDEIYFRGIDPKNFVESMILRLADLTRALYQSSFRLEQEPTQLASSHASALQLGQDWILKTRIVLADIHKTLKDISLPKIWLESEWIRLCENPTQHPLFETPEKKQNDLENLKKEISSKPEIHQQLEDKTKEETVWHELVEHLAKMSKTASARLSQTVFLEKTEHDIIIGFSRELDKEWAENNLKIQTAICNEWKNMTGEEINIKFQLIKTQAKNESSSVRFAEVSVEGEALIEMAKEVFHGLTPDTMENK